MSDNHINNEDNEENGQESASSLIERASEALEESEKKHNHRISQLISDKKKSTVAYNVISANKIELLYNNLPISLGLTIANSLRRSIIAFSSGYAITFVRIAGADHAFAPILGVAEDYINIILNIRGLIIKHSPTPHVNEWFKIKLQGPGELTGEHFNIPGKVEILNTNHKICSISNFNNLELEFMVTSGFGFVTSQDHREKLDMDPLYYGSFDFDKAVILDTNYSPVKSVTYNISEPFNKTEDMSLLVETNGSVSAEKVINDAIQILIPVYKEINPNLKINDNDEIESHRHFENKYDETLSIKIDDPSLGLSTRSINGLRRQSIYTLGDLAKQDESDIIRFQNIGKNSATEIKNLMKARGISFVVSSSES